MLCYSNDQVGESLPCTPTLVRHVLRPGRTVPRDEALAHLCRKPLTKCRLAGWQASRLAGWQGVWEGSSQLGGRLALVALRAMANHTRERSLAAKLQKQDNAMQTALDPPLVVACACMPQRGDQERPHPPPSAGPCPRRSSASRISRPRLQASSAASTSATNSRFALLTLLLLSHCGPYLFNPHT